MAKKTPGKLTFTLDLYHGISFALPSLKPKQKKELKRSRKATVMYTENEYAKIEANAREMEVTVSSYIRAKSLRGYARVPKHSKIYAKSIKELSEKSKEQKVPQPPGDANRNSENWSAYIKAKTEHSGDKKERRQRLYMTQREEMGELRDRQRLERQTLASSFGKGVSRWEINRRRSILGKPSRGMSVSKSMPPRKRAGSIQTPPRLFARMI
jgi:hypothetical protein